MGNRASVLDGIGQDIAEPETMPKLIIQDQTPFFYKMKTARKFKGPENPQRWLCLL